MYSKSLFHGFIVSFVLLSGCQSFIEDTKPVDTKLSLAGDTSCMADVADQLQNSLDQKKTVSEVAQPFDCINHSLDIFMQHTKGYGEDRYSAEELRNFAHRYFLSEDGVVTSEISDSLLAGVMKFKTVLAGGDTESLSDNEIRTIQSFLSLIRDQLIQLKPHILVLTEDELSTKGQKASYKGARLGIQSAADRISSHFDGGSFRYTTGELKTLVSELTQFMEASPETTEKSAAWVDILEWVKRVLVNPEADVLGPQDLTQLIKTIGRLADLGIAAAYETELSLRRDSIISFNAIAQQAIEMLNTGLRKRSHAFLNFSEVRVLLTALHKADLLSARYALELIPNTAETVLSKLFAGLNRVDAKQITGLNDYDFERLHTLFKGWSSSQLHISDNLEGGDLPTSELIANLKQVQTGAETEKSENLGRFISFLERPHQTLLSGDEFVINYEENVTLMNFKTASYSNLIRSAFELLYPAYAVKNDSIRANQRAGLTKDEYEEFYFDIRDLGIEMDFFDIRSTTVGTRMFYEGDLLSNYGNGNLLLETDEFVNVLLNYLSTGRKLAERVYDSLIAQGCGHPSVQDLNGKALLNLDCASSKLVPTYIELTSAAPHLKTYMSSLTEEQRHAMGENILGTGLSSTSCPAGYEYSDLQTSLVILAYTEIALTRFDVNRDQVLSRERRQIDEISKVAYPIFKEILISAIRQIVAPEFVEKAIKNAKSIFKYILNTGSLPQTEGRTAEEITSDIFRGIMRAKADRFKLVQAFNIIGSAISGGPSDFDPNDSCVEIGSTNSKSWGSNNWGKKD